MSGCFSADRNGPITRSERICVLVRTPVTVGGREINAGWKSRKVTLSRVTHPPTFWLAMAWMVVGRRDRGEEPLAAHARATEGTRAGTGRPEPFADVATPEQTLPSPECRNPIEVDRGAWVSSQAATWSRTTTANAPRRGSRRHVPAFRGSGFFTGADEMHVLTRLREWVNAPGSVMSVLRKRPSFPIACGLLEGREGSSTASCPRLALGGVFSGGRRSRIRLGGSSLARWGVA